MTGAGERVAGRGYHAKKSREMKPQRQIEGSAFAMFLQRGLHPKLYSQSWPVPAVKAASLASVILIWREYAACRVKNSAGRTLKLGTGIRLVLAPSIWLRLNWGSFGGVIPASKACLDVRAVLVASQRALDLHTGLDLNGATGRRFHWGCHLGAST